MPDRSNRGGRWRASGREWLRTPRRAGGRAGLGRHCCASGRAWPCRRWRYALLIGNAHGGLQRIERAALHGVESRFAVAAVAHEADLTGIPRLLQNGDHVTLAQFLLGAGVQLHQIEMVGLQAFQAAVDALLQQLRIPVRQIDSRSVAALGKEDGNRCGGARPRCRSAPRWLRSILPCR